MLNRPCDVATAELIAEGYVTIEELAEILGEELELFPEPGHQSRDCGRLCMEHLDDLSLPGDGHESVGPAEGGDGA